VGEGPAVETTESSQQKPRLRTRSITEAKRLLSHLRVTPWTLGIGMGTLVVLVVAVLWLTGLPSYLQNNPPAWGWFALAVVVAYGQYVGYAISLLGASDPRPSPLRTLQLELAEAVTYVYTPESVGSLALTIRFLTRQKLSSAQAAAAAGLSAFVTTIVSAILIPIAAIIAASTINTKELKSQTPSTTWEVILGIIVLAGAVTILVKAPTLRSKVGAWLKQAWAYLRIVAAQPTRGLRIAGGEIVTLASQIACMSLILLSLHASPKIAALLVITQIAGAASSVVPIPGGLGAPEAILVAGLNAIGVHHSEAIIAALTYRMLTYWLPPIPGAVALYDLFRRDLV
jgi:undecaprenyl-diphosphatase